MEELGINNDNNSDTGKDQYHEYLKERNKLIYDNVIWNENKEVKQICSNFFPRHW